MKLYQFDLAPSSNRVNLFIKETGIKVPTVQLNVRDGDQFKEPYKSLNPFHCVPFLELDNGAVISESMAICRFLEETNDASIKLFGTTSQERAIIEMWNRRLEIDGYLPLMNGIRNKCMNYIKFHCNESDRLDLKIDCLAAEFEDWKYSFLEQKSRE